MEAARVRLVGARLQRDVYGADDGTLSLAVDRRETIERDALGTRKERFARSPDARQESYPSGDPFLGPGKRVFGGSGREQEQPHRIDAVSLDRIVDTDDVPAALAHLFAVVEERPLIEEARERLRRPRRPTHVDEELVEEARVEQVEHRVLGAADILIDRHPGPDARRIPGSVFVMRIDIANEVPR